MEKRDLSGIVGCIVAQVILGVSVPLTRGIVDYPVMTGQAVRYALAAAALGLLVRVRFGELASRTGRQSGELASRTGRQSGELASRTGRQSGELASRTGRQSGELASRPDRRGWPGRRDLLALLGVAVTGLVGFNLCMVTAVRHADPAVVGTIVGAAPLGLAFLGPLMRRQPPTARIVTAAALIVAGTALVHGFGQSDAIGTLAALGTLAGEIAFSVFAAMALPRLGAVRVSAYSCALAVPLLVVGAVASGEVPRMPTAVEAATFAYLAVMLTVVAFVLWFSGLMRLGVARAGLFVGLAPVAAIVTASIQDGRWPVPAQAFGVLVVAVALTFGLGQRATEPATAESADDVVRSRTPTVRTG